MAGKVGNFNATMEEKSEERGGRRTRFYHLAEAGIQRDVS